MLWVAAVVGFAVTLLAAVSMAYAPRWALESRAPGEEERRTFASFATDAEAPAEDCPWTAFDLDRLQVVLGEDRSAAVHVVGLPGRRTLFVTRALLSSEPPVARGLLAIAATRAELGSDLIRATLAGVVVAGMIVVFVTPIALPVGWALLAVAGLAAFALARRLHYAADRQAARAVGEDAVLAALRTLADGTAGSGGSRWRTLVAIEPPLADRVERLEAE